MRNSVILRWCAFALCAGFVARATAQDVPTILQVDLENYVVYPGPARLDSLRNFFTNIILADITAINGGPAKGVMVLRTQSLQMSPTPNPGMSVADVEEQAYAQFSWEFLTADGSPVGSIFGMGLAGGDPAPGSPAEATGGNVAIVGGTGAFAGARGTINDVDSSGVRVALRPRTLPDVESLGEDVHALCCSYFRCSSRRSLACFSTATTRPLQQIGRPGLARN
jgi:hypothetical protein